MSWPSSNSSNTNNRSSIFETFNSPSFGGDDNFDVDAGRHLYDQQQPMDAVNDDGFVYFTDSPVEEEENVATLFMSCSPGRDSENDDDDDDDDSVPLSQLQISKQQSTSGSRKKGTTTGKKQKKTKKDPSAPKKPLSAYKLFFRDTLASIKSQNPETTFGDVSRIVSSMWEGLEAHEKEKYSNLADKERQTYAKALAVYQDKGKSESQPKKKKSTEKKARKKKSVEIVSSDGSDSDVPNPKNPTAQTAGSDSDFDMDNMSDSSDSSSLRHNQTAPQCSRSGCGNSAVDDPRWDFDYCSANCVVLHCRDVFTAWVASRKTAKV